MPFGEFDDLVELVLEGEVDAVLLDHGYAVNKLAENGEKLEIIGQSVPLDRGQGIGVRKDSPLRRKSTRLWRP